MPWFDTSFKCAQHDSHMLTDLQHGQMLCHAHVIGHLFREEWKTLAWWVVSSIINVISLAPCPRYPVLHLRWTRSGRKTVYQLYAWWCQYMETRNALLTETKWSTFSRSYFQIHFLEWKLLYFDWNFTVVCSYRDAINNVPSLVQ